LTASQGFVAPIGWKTCFPFPQTDLAYGLGDRYAKSGIAVADCDADLDFCDLPSDILIRRDLVQKFG
jgi:hypothetical protein